MGTGGSKSDRARSSERSPLEHSTGASLRRSTSIAGTARGSVSHDGFGRRLLRASGERDHGTAVGRFRLGEPNRTRTTQRCAWPGGGNQDRVFPTSYAVGSGAGASSLELARTLHVPNGL